MAFEALTRENEVLKSALSTARENALREAAAMARTHRDTQVATLRDWTKRVGDELAADILALALPQKESKE